MNTVAGSNKRVAARAVRGMVFAGYPDHETVWAIAAGIEGMVHVAVCCETTGGGTVQLCSYDIARRRIHHALDVARAINEPAQNGHASHGKVHFSLCPSKDGFLYAATHCSTPPLGDRIWNAHTMWNDREKSFTGAHFFRFHPVTKQFEDFGRLFPNEGVGVLALDDETASCVGVTYPTGRLFFVDKDGKNLTDMGRVAETYTLALVPGGNGYVYGTDTYGYFMRINMKARSVEHLPARVPSQLDSSGRYTAMSDVAMGPDGYVYFCAYRIPRIFRFAPTPTGPIHVEEVGGMGGPGLCFGDDGMLYCSSPTCHLNRFDIRTGRAEDLGLLRVNGADRRFWRCVKGKDGLLYAGECGRKPVNLIIIDPARL